MHLGTWSLTLTVDGVTRTGDISDCRIVSGPAPTDRESLIRGAPLPSWDGPQRAYRLQGVGAQDPAAGSLWDLVWSSVGMQVEVDLRPAGGGTASEDQPWFVGTVTISEPDGDLLGGPADPSRANRFTFEIDWYFTAKPTRVVA